MHLIRLHGSSFSQPAAGAYVSLAQLLPRRTDKLFNSALHILFCRSILLLLALLTLFALFDLDSPGYPFREQMEHLLFCDVLQQSKVLTAVCPAKSYSPAVVCISRRNIEILFLENRRDYVLYSYDIS